MDASEILASAVVGGFAGVLASGWIAVRTERGKTKEVARRSGLAVLTDLGNALKEVRLQPNEEVGRLDRDDAVDFARRLLHHTDDLGLLRRREIRRHLARLVGRHTVRVVDELPATAPDQQSRDRYTWREVVWILEQVNDHNVPEDEILAPGYLGAVRKIILDRDDAQLRATWDQAVGEMKAIGFFLGDWAQWRRVLSPALLHRRRVGKRSHHGGELGRPAAR